MLSDQITWQQLNVTLAFYWSRHNLLELTFFLYFQQDGNDPLSQQLYNTILSVTKLAGVSFILLSSAITAFKGNYF